MVSVRADMGVLCLLDDLRSRALALPVPFLDAGAMVEDGLLAWYEGAARASCPHDLSSRGPGVDTKEASQSRSGSREWRWRSDCCGARVVLLVRFQQSWSMCVVGRRMQVVNVAVLYFGIAGVRDSLLRLKVVVTRTSQRLIRAESPQVGVDLDG